MYKGFKIIDSDSHSMEPIEIWDKYLEPEYRPWAPGGSKSPRPGTRLNEVGFSIAPDGTAGPAWIEDGEGGKLTYAEAYKPYLDRKFDGQAYLSSMDLVGIDKMVIYPTAAMGLTTILTSTGRQLQSPPVSAALWRAYNSWLYDFCNETEGRVLGAAGVDLRSAEMAAQEARRAVKELGMKALFVVPQPSLGIPMQDPYYDTLWGEVAELGVPIGIHGLQGSSHIGLPYWDTSWPMGRAATAFPMEEMLFCLSMCAGGILERHPKLKVVFLESSAGWATFWNWWMDDKWRQTQVVREQETPEMPSFYFKRNCFISAEPDEPGIHHCVIDGLEDNLVTATDFPHPEDADFPRVLDHFFEYQPTVINETQMRKILYDNPARLYNIS